MELINECWEMKDSKEEIKAAEEIEATSYYYENIFNIDDFYLYRGIAKFYQGDYQESNQDYFTSNRLKLKNKTGSDSTDWS